MATYNCEQKLTHSHRRYIILKFITATLKMKQGKQTPYKYTNRTTHKTMQTCKVKLYNIKTIIRPHGNIKDTRETNTKQNNIRK